MEIKIKICGITNLNDAIICAEYGADLIGFIFASSMRMVNPKNVKDIIKKMPGTIKKVGVFKDAPIDDINEIISFTGIDGVQLHGCESPEYCGHIKNAFVIKRIKIGNDTNREKILAEIRRYNVFAYLFDPGEGSGNVFDWKIIKDIKGVFIIGGGLNQNNVRSMIELLKPYGVDVCSGVEKFPGKKDLTKVKEFIKEVRKCSLQV